MRLFGHPIGAPALFGLAVIAANLVAAAFAPWLAPHDQTAIVGEVWAPISRAAWLGTDNLGRDIASRLIYGARTTIAIALATTLLSFALGGTLGFLVAVAGGWVDTVCSRLVDTLMAIPTLIFTLVVLSVAGTSTPTLILTIAALDATRVFRVSRAVAMGIAALDFVEVARLRGEGWGWIMRAEILPNALPPLTAEFALRFCFAFLFIAALSFIGLGVQPPLADWGGMVRDNAQVINFGGLAPLLPAAAIALLTVAVNLVADWILAIQARRPERA